MLSKIIKRVLVFSILLTFVCSALGLTQEIKYIRVAILRDAPSFKIKIRGRFKILAFYTDELLYEAKSLKTSEVLPLGVGIRIKTMDFPVFGIKVIPKKDAAIYINNRRFRGQVNIIRDKNKQLLVVNRLKLEDYIKGVLYHEISHHWPIETIKAQAVAARTYAYFQATQSSQRDYDVTSDIYSQVYGGKTSERLRTNIAVNKTKGQFLTYEGKIFPTYYHATCGGHTEEANNLWKIKLFPLKGVECKFCTKSPHFRWEKNLRLRDIQTKLNDAGYKIGLIKEIKILQKNSSGRVSSLEIIDRGNISIIISAKDFRQTVGPNIIKSNNYEITMKGYYVDFLGFGWGHGVGLCQWGAYFMGRSSFSYQKILQHYYPLAKIAHEVN